MPQVFGLYLFISMPENPPWPFWILSSCLNTLRKTLSGTKKTICCSSSDEYDHTCMRHIYSGGGVGLHLISRTSISQHQIGHICFWMTVIFISRNMPHVVPCFRYCKVCFVQNGQYVRSLKKKPQHLAPWWLAEDMGQI